MRKLTILLCVGMLIAMMIPAGFSSSPTAPQVGAAIESGNLNPSGLYMIDCGMDATINSSFPNTNYGGGNFDVVGYGNYALMQFNTSSLPDNLDIQSAVLTFEIESTIITDWSAIDRSEQVILDIDRITSAWDEGIVTWNTKPTEGGPEYYFGIKRVSPWTYQNDSASFQWQLIWIEVDITYLVEHWYSGAYDNYGLLFYPDSYCNYTTANIYSRHVFNSPPRIEITATSILSTVHLSYYNAFTGLGIAPYTFNVSTKVGTNPMHRTTQDITSAIIGQNLTVNVTDYFGRTLYNVTRMINDSDYFWDIALPVYSYKFTNNGDQYTRLWMYYDPAQPPYRCFIPPHETESFYLYPGWYRFAATVYDENGVTGLTYTWPRTVSGIGYVMLNGATITEVLDTALGVQAQQNVITDILTPNVIWLGYDMPMVPSHILMTNSSSTLPTRIVVESGTFQIKAGNYSWFNATAPAATTVTTRTILYDDFHLMGNVSTEIRVNDSAGTMVYNASILPSDISLFGKDYTIWTNKNISVSRSLGFRYSSAFSYNYYLSGHPLGSMIYEVDVAFQNPSDTTWRSISLFIPFQNMTKADNSSLIVWDLNNSIYLTEGVHYAVSNTGVYMFFPTIDNGTWRGFRVSYSTANNTPTEPVHVIVTTVGDDSGLTLTWQSMQWYFAKTSWTNNFARQYNGPIYLEMQTNPAMDYTQQVVVQNENGYVLNNVIIAGTTIIIPSISVNVGDEVSYTILFKSSSAGTAPGELTIAELSITTFCMVLTSATLIASFILKIMGYRSKVQAKAEKLDYYADNLLTIGLIALAGLVFSIIYAFGVG